MEDIAAWKLVVAGLGILCGGTRLAGFLKAVLALLKVFAEGTERAANLVGPGTPDLGVKEFVKNRVSGRNGEVAALAELFAAKAEKIVGAPDGSATKRRKASKGKRVLQGVARWAPIIGAFL
jgi:hypothetical protein